ncbi:MAG: aminoacetone oxidase family FAD-binding enzyme [Phycisphaerae bacterium]
MDLAVVGGGAAGLAAAIFHKRTNASARVIVLDGASKLGAKILISGGGRCNVANARVTPDDFNGGSRNFVRRVLERFPASGAVEFFRQLGVALHEEEHGKLFPDSNRAASVLDALLNEASRLGIEVRAPWRVGGVEARGGVFHISRDQTRPSVADSTGTLAAPRNAREFTARRVVLATGGLSFPRTGSDGGGFAIARSLGHSIVPTTPALAPLVLEGDFHCPLSGLSQPVELTIRARDVKAQRIGGALLWTHFGVSGPAPMDASRVYLRRRLENRAPALYANFLPGEAFESAESWLSNVASASPTTRIRTALSARLPARFVDAAMTRLSVPPETALAHLTRPDRRRVRNGLLGWPLSVADSRGYDYAEATAGGVALDEVDWRRLESRVCPGLHFVGEILDVDGRIGGFNFQWAWSSAFVAGTGIPPPP